MKHSSPKMALSAGSFVILSAAVILFMIGVISPVIAVTGVLIAGFFMAIAIVL